MALCLSPDGKQFYVANSGLFEYKAVPGADDADRLHTGLHFPPFGYPSKEARTGMVVEGRSIPGLGEENDPRGSSLWTYALSGLNKARLVATLRLGAPILSSKGVVVGGAAPSAVVAGAKAVYVALAHEDALAVVSADGRRLDREIPLSPLPAAEYRDSEGHPLRGVMPDGLALSGGRLYVTEAGIDALGVIDVASGHVEGHLPVGWSPSAVIVSPDGKTLYVSNSKGKSSGPNGGGKFDPSPPRRLHRRSRAGQHLRNPGESGEHWCWKIASIVPAKCPDPIRDPGLHLQAVPAGYVPNTFSTSSPKRFITLTAILPVLERSKGRLVVE